MAHIVILGAGLSGSLLSYEMREHIGKDDKITVINKGTLYQFVPSNPWVAVGRRQRKDIEVDLAPVMAKNKIAFETCGASRIHPAENKITLEDGRAISYDYLVIATGPEAAFDEIEGFGPEQNTSSICLTPHAEKTAATVQKLIENPGPVIIGAVQGASCFGPAYEFAFILDTELKKHKIRDRMPMTFVTSEPYIGHLGLDGVGDTKGLLESELRNRHIKWITNARVKKAEPDKLTVEEISEDGNIKKTQGLPFVLTMMMPAFRGVAAVRGIEGLTNPRGFVLIDEYQRNPAFPNIYAIGVCVAIAPGSKTLIPTGIPKTGFMIESMATAAAKNIGALLKGEPPHFRATWNAVCLADFGDSGVAFVAQPQIPPRNVNWSSHGKWVHLAKIAFEKYFLYKVRSGKSMTCYEKFILKALGIQKIKDK